MTVEIDDGLCITSLRSRPSEMMQITNPTTPLFRKQALGPIAHRYSSIFARIVLSDKLRPQSAVLF